MIRSLIIGGVSALSLVFTLSAYAASDLALDCKFKYSQEHAPNSDRSYEGKDVALRLNFDIDLLDIDEVRGIRFQRAGSIISFSTGMGEHRETGASVWVFRYTLNGTNGAMTEKSFVFTSCPDSAEYGCPEFPKDSDGRSHVGTTYYTCQKVNVLF